MLESNGIQCVSSQHRTYLLAANKKQEDKNIKLSVFDLKLNKIRSIEDPYQKSLALIKLGSEMDEANVARYKVNYVFREAFEVALTIESDSIKAHVLSELGSELDKRGFHKGYVSKVYLKALEALNRARSFAEYRYQREYTDRIGYLLCQMAGAGLYKEALFFTAIITEPSNREAVISMIISKMAEHGLTIGQIKKEMHNAGLPNSDINKALE